MFVGSRLDSAFAGRRRRASAPPEKPFRDELLERRAARRAGALARGQVHGRPELATVAARSVFPRFDDNGRVLREAYRALADDVHRGEFVTAAAEWLLDNYHLVASEIRHVRQNLPRAVLPRAAQAGRTRAGGERARLRPRRRADPPQRQPPRPRPARALPGQLPDGRPAHHRRALGLAEHAEARPHREPAAPRGRDCWPRAAATARRRRVRGADRRRRARSRPPPLPRALHPAHVVQLLQRVREYGPRLAAVRSGLDDAPRSRPADARRRRSGASTSARPPPRSPSRTSSPACASARSSRLDASTSRR